ncbi:MAG TPA: hypothetical protein DG754_09955 [Bacteroidales bacterium]|jgi:predicted  nucleic acid-binding Zn-ribbon protein|nr:hypothetical protein [Bacteroidales bacterium]
MNNEEKILAAIEEIAHQLGDLKKNSSKSIDNESLATLTSKLDAINETLEKRSSEMGIAQGADSIILSEIKAIQQQIKAERPEVTHRYIEVKKPRSWVIGVVSYFLVSVVLCFLLVVSNVNLKREVKAISPNDYKYRYLKLKSFRFDSFKTGIKTTTDLLYLIDEQYINNEQDLKQYVLQRENEIRRAFEASEIAKQKEAEAKAAKAEAEKLRSGLHQK